jgi:hypothetical protein
VARTARRAGGARAGARVELGALRSCGGAMRGCGRQMRQLRAVPTGSQRLSVMFGGREEAQEVVCVVCRDECWSGCVGRRCFGAPAPNETMQQVLEHIYRSKSTNNTQSRGASCDLHKSVQSK